MTITFGLSDRADVKVGSAKAYAKLFKRATAPYVHGPFGPPTPPTVEKAYEAGNLYGVWEDGEPLVLAICNRLKSGSTHVDFTGAEWKINKGDLFVSDIALAEGAPTAAVANLLDEIQAQHEAAMWIEIYEEDGVMRRIVDAQNFYYRGTKINAYGDITALYLRDWGHRFDDHGEAYIGEHDVATLTMLSEGYISRQWADAILVELDHFAQWWEQYGGSGVWADHYSTYNKRNTWSAFSLRNFEPDNPTSIVKPQEMPKQWKAEHPDLLDAQCADSIAFEHFPSVQGVMLKLLEDGYATGFERVRLMRLTANGGELTRHSDITDRKAGTRDGYVSRLHIPLHTTREVEFSMWGHRGAKFQRFLSPNDLWYLDMRKPHAAVNKSQDVERIHLVIDVVAGHVFRHKLAEAWGEEHASGAEQMVGNPLW